MNGKIKGETYMVWRHKKIYLKNINSLIGGKFLKKYKFLYWR